MIYLLTDTYRNISELMDSILKLKQMAHHRICLHTGVKSSGVADGDDNSVVKLMPDPKSKSHILIGHNFSVDTHRIFSGFKSR